MDTKDFDSREHYQAFARWLDQVDDYLLAKEYVLPEGFEPIDDFEMLRLFNHSESAASVAESIISKDRTIS